MKSAVIELSGFQLSPFSFVVKELACADENGFYKVWTFQPPHAWDVLSAKKQRSYQWVTRNLHGLAWTSGDLPYNRLRPILQMIFSKYSTLFVKGLQKKKFLKRFTNVDIVELEEDLPNQKHE
ncbi:hypothetical protein RF55_19907, partial [Lasius niger]